MQFVKQKSTEDSLNKGHSKLAMMLKQAMLMKFQNDLQNMEEQCSEVEDKLAKSKSKVKELEKATSKQKYTEEQYVEEIRSLESRIVDLEEINS